MARTSGQRKYLPVNSAQTNFTDLTADVDNGRRVDHSVVGGELYVNYAAALTAAGGPNLRAVQLGNFNGARIKFFGVASDNDTFAYRIWTVTPVYASTAPSLQPGISDILAVDIESYAIGTGIFGTATGKTGDLISATELLADTLTFALSSSATTPTGPATQSEGAYAFGSADVYTPADNTSAKLIIPDFGNAFGFVIEFDRGANTSTNCVYELTS